MTQWYQTVMSNGNVLTEANPFISDEIHAQLVHGIVTLNTLDVVPGGRNKEQIKNQYKIGITQSTRHDKL